MHKKFVFSGLALSVIIAAITAYIVEAPGHTAVSRISAARGLTGDQAAGSAYDVNFVLSKTPAGTINAYLPRYVQTGYETAVMYSSMFGIEGTMDEDDNAYIFSDGVSHLFIYKNAGYILYEADEHITGDEHNMVTDDRDAATIASAFLEEKGLFLNYEEARVERLEDGGCEIGFIGRIGNIKNYAFVNTVRLDNYGRVMRAEYYYHKYDRLGSSRIKSMREAFYELPQDMPFVVDLQNCQLVYIFENSIVQPAYMFEGELPGDKSYQCFVKAAIYQ